MAGMMVVSNKGRGRRRMKERKGSERKKMEDLDMSYVGENACRISRQQDGNLSVQLHRMSG